MNVLLTTLLVGISLSMDAFSLALIYGTYGLKKKDIYLLAIIVGIFHFFMPLIGIFFGTLIYEYFIFNINLIVSIIFGVIGVEMIISSTKEETPNLVINLFGFLLFGLSVSIDSLTTGIGLSVINNNYLQCSSIFMITSGIFTYIGLLLGNKLNVKLGRLSTTIGGIILIILAIYYFVS